LILSQKEDKKKIGEKVKVINIDGKTDPRIKREVNNSYILGYSKIVFKGAEVKRRIKNLQEILHRLIALEVMEQTHDTMVAKNFLNMDTVSVNELLRKMDIVTRAMFSEACEDFTEETYINLNERDKDVNRLYFLLYRTILYNLENPLKSLKNLKLASPELLNYHFCGFYLEKVADEIRRIARFTHRLNLNKTQETELKDFLTQINQFYLNVMKAIYKKDKKTAFELAEKKKIFNKILNESTDRNKKIDGYEAVVSRIYLLLNNIHCLVKTAYHGNHYLEIMKK